MITNIIKFYTYGRQYAPKGWPIKNPPYTNRLYCIYGGTAFFLNGEKEYRLKPHHLYVFPHSLEFCVCQLEDDPVDHLFFDFTIIPPFLFREFIEINIDDDTPLGYTVSALSHILSRFKEKDDGSILTKLVRSYFENLLLLISRERNLMQLDDTRLISVLEHIHNHFYEPVSIRELASIANLEENHFIRIFKKTMSMTPYQYLREYRFNMAFSYLESGMSVSETAQKIGYENISSFSNALKKSRGIYPSKLRQANKA